jgi:UDP-glucose 4-epimerase
MKKRTILLLGGFGFIGSNILSYVDAFMAGSFEVIVFDRHKQHRKGHQFLCVTKVYEGEISNELDVEIIFQENAIDLVLHALNTTVPSTSGNARFDIESNVIPTIALLDIMVKYGVKNIIYLSSGGAIYGNNNAFAKHKEGDLAYPVSSYGIAKLAIEKYIYQYNYLYNINALILRLSNPYGKYHYNERQGIVNIAARSAWFSTPFFVWGDGNTEKDYIYIEDFCEILFRLIEVKSSFLIVNVGSNQVISINSILQSVQKFIPSFTWQYRDRVKTDVQRVELDTTRLLSIIGPYRFTPFSIGLDKTITWLKTEYSKQA